MSLVKVVEVVAQSEKSFDDATRQAVKEAAKSVRGIKSIWIDNFSADIEDEKIVHYRVNAKISFLLEGNR